MATKKNLTKEPVHPLQNSDAVVYKVMVALLLACAALLGLRALRNFYDTVDGMAKFYSQSGWIAITGLIAAAVSGAALLTLRKLTAVRLVAPWVLVLGLLMAYTGWNIRTSHTQDFAFLYFLVLACLVQYIIFQLYQWEFFLFSLSTVTVGGLFFSFDKGIHWSGKNILLMIIVLAVLFGTALCTMKASKNRGWLQIGSMKLRLFYPKATPILICIVDVLWLICIVAMLLLGSLFAYYGKYAALAVEFIAAVYYTFQLN